MMTPLRYCRRRFEMLFLLLPAAATLIIISMPARSTPSFAPTLLRERACLRVYDGHDVDV